MDIEDDGRLADHAGQIATLNAELDRQRSSHQNRSAAANSRAALLIGSAAIASGVQASTGFNGWQILAIASSLVAAVLGTLSMWPRIDTDVTVRPFVVELYKRSSHVLEFDLLKAKLHAHEKDEAALLLKARLLRPGFASLVIAIVFTGLQAAGVDVSINS
jgi:hypothetical protein